MAGYGYTTYGRTGPRTSEWTQITYVADVPPDHLCRPVIIDAQGRRQPIVFTPDESYSDDYKSSYVVRMEPTDHGSATSNWVRPSSPVWDRDRPPKVEEFITKIQTEVSQPPRTSGPLGNPNWCQTLDSTSRQGTTAGYTPVYKVYNKDREYDNNDWQSGDVPKDKTYNEYYRVHDTRVGPVALTARGQAARPSHGTQLTSATNDIGTALGLLKEAAAKPSSAIAAPSSVAAAAAAAPRPRFSIGVPRRTDPYPETIDSREAERRYGNFNASSRSYTAGEAYPGATITSKEAAERYNGALVG